MWILIFWRIMQCTRQSPSPFNQVWIAFRFLNILIIIKYIDQSGNITSYILFNRHVQHILLIILIHVLLLDSNHCNAKRFYMIYSSKRTIQFWQVKNLQENMIYVLDSRTKLNLKACFNLIFIFQKKNELSYVFIQNW